MRWNPLKVARGAPRRSSPRKRPSPLLLVEELETRMVPSRMLYAVNQSPAAGVGSISVYDMDNGHQLVNHFSDSDEPPGPPTLGFLLRTGAPGACTR